MRMFPLMVMCLSSHSNASIIGSQCTVCSYVECRLSKIGFVVPLMYILFFLFHIFKTLASLHPSKSLYSYQCFVCCRLLPLILHIVSFRSSFHKAIRIKCSDLSRLLINKEQYQMVCIHRIQSANLKHHVPQIYGVTLQTKSSMNMYTRKDGM